MPSCAVQEFKFKNKNLNFAVAEINGRYPENGRAMNMVSDMVYYSLGGEGRAYLGNKARKIKIGEALVIPKKIKYYIMGKKLSVIIISNPIWDIKQYKILPQ